MVFRIQDKTITVLLRINAQTPPLLNAPLIWWKYENPFVITDITEAAPQFTLIEEIDIDINVEDDILVVD